MAERELAILLKARDMASGTIKGVKKELGGLDRSVGRVGKATSAAIGNIEKGVAIGTGAVVAGLGYSVKAAVDFEDAFAGVRKTVDETDLSRAGLSFEQLSEDIRGMAREMPIAAGEIAKVAENAGALGIAAADIGEFTRVATLLGVTTDVSADEASTALGQLTNVLGLTAAEYDNFGATLVDLGNKGASTEAQILEISRRAGGGAKLVGLAADETLAWSAAVANLGINSELGGTALQSMFQKTLTIVNDGGKHLRDMAKVAGVTGKEFEKAFAEDANGALMLFVKGLSEMDKGERLSAVQDLFGKTSGLNRTILGLAESYDKNLVPAVDNAAKAWKANTALTEESEKRFKTTASQLQILRNNVHDAAITIGSALLPELLSLSRQGTKWIQDNQSEIKVFARDLARGVRDAVTWAKSLDWDAIGGALKAGATGAKAIADAFLGLPPGIQAFLAGGFAANKFTGGFLGDIVGDLGKGLIKGVLGMNAGVVNIKAAVVNGAGPGGVGGVAGGGKPTPGKGGKGPGGFIPGLGVLGGIGTIALNVSGDTIPVADQTTQDRILTLQRSIDNLNQQDPTAPTFSGSSETNAELITRLQAELARLRSEQVTTNTKLTGIESMAGRTKDDTVGALNRVTMAEAETRREAGRGLAIVDRSVVNGLTRSATAAAAVAGVVRTVGDRQYTSVESARAQASLQSSRQLEVLQGVRAKAQQTAFAIRDKDFTAKVTVPVQVTARLSVRDSTAAITAYRTATGSGR